MSFPPSRSWPASSPAGPAPLDQPQYGASIGQAASRFWRKFATFSGRASRSEYWWWALISFVISVVLQMVGGLIFGGAVFFDVSTSRLDLRTLLLPLAPALVWSLLALVPTIALAVRRLHDSNHSGWWYLLTLPSLIGGVFLLVGTASVDPERIAVGDINSLAISSFVAGGLFSLIGLVGSIIVLVFLIVGPDPHGIRFDRQGSQPAG